MATIARVLVRVSLSDEFETAKLLTAFGLAGLVLATLAARCGLDTRWALF